MLSWFRCPASELGDSHLLRLQSDILRGHRRSQSLVESREEQRTDPAQNEVAALIEEGQDSAGGLQDEEFLRQGSKQGQQRKQQSYGEEQKPSEDSCVQTAFRCDPLPLYKRRVLRTDDFATNGLSVPSSFQVHKRSSHQSSIVWRGCSRSPESTRGERVGEPSAHGGWQRRCSSQRNDVATQIVEASSEGGQCTTGGSTDFSTQEGIRGSDDQQIEEGVRIALVDAISWSTQLQLPSLHSLPALRTLHRAHDAIRKSDPEDLSSKSTKEQPFNFRSETQTEQEYLGLQNQNATCSQVDGSVESPMDTQKPETLQERLGREDPKGVGSGASSSTQNSNIGIKSGLKVADRIRNFEQKAVPLMSANATKPDNKFQYAKDSSGSDRSRKSKGEIQVVFPLHLKKFRRRASGAGPVLRAETPLYRSQPEGEQYLHAPLPQRRSTLVANTPPGIPPPLEPGEDLVELALQPANDEATKSRRRREEQQSAPATSKDVLSSTAPIISLTQPNKADPKDMSPEPVSSAASQQSVDSTADPYPARASQQPTAGGHTTARALQPSAPVAPSKYLSPTRKQRINPFAHFQGTRGTCIRHGRKYGNGSWERRSVPAIREMFVKGRSDASKSYSDACPDCVAELHIRKRELDQSSEGYVQPTVQAVRNIATNDGSMNPIASDFATPSVPAEQSNSNPASVIEKQGATEPTKPAAETSEEVRIPLAGDSDVLSRGDTFASTLVEPSSSLRSSPYPVSVASSNQEGNTSSTNGDGLASTPAGSEAQSSSGSVKEESYPADEEQPTWMGPRTKSVHFRDLPCTIKDGQLVISRDLGEGYDAMVLERGGRLERLVVNSRHGQPNAETMTRIARELLMVSSALSEAQAGLSPESSTTSETDRTVVVDRGSHVESAQEVSDDEVISLFDEALGTLEPGLVHHTPSPIPHAQHPDIEVEYEALQEHSGVNGPYSSFAETDDALLNRQALQPSQQSTSRWPIPLNPSFGSTQSLMTDRYRDSSNDSQPLASIRVRSRNSHMGSEGVPITSSSPKAKEMPSSPTLPSHVLRAEDTMSPPLQEPHSPLFFTTSTAPSLGGPSPIFGKVRPIIPENPMSPPLPGSPTLTVASAQVSPQSLPGSFQELSRADSKVIRHVMRMEIQNKAVQEAAEKERQARRQRSILADAKKALGLH